MHWLLVQLNLQWASNVILLVVVREDWHDTVECLVALDLSVMVY